ncbi:MAG: hypothetical protein AAGP08_09840 [Pseudomonadota bacterium]
MEAAALFVLLVFFVLAVASNGATKRRERKQSDASSTDTHVEPFNRETAKPVPEREVVEGPAFVVDGDTVKIRKTQIRLFGVDAPEMNHPYGKKAKWALVALCKGANGPR